MANLPICAPVDNFVAQLVYEGQLEAYSLKEQLVSQPGSFQQRARDTDIVHTGRLQTSQSDLRSNWVEGGETMKIKIQRYGKEPRTEIEFYKL